MIRPSPQTLVKIFFAIILFGSITTSSTWYFLHQSPQLLLSPLGEAGRILGFGDLLDSHKQIVFGFLPYWNFKYIDEIDVSHLTHLAIFGINFEPDGSIQTREEDYMEPGYRNLTSDKAEMLINRLNSLKIKPVLTLTGFDNDTMESVLSSPDIYRRAISESLNFAQTYGYQGINVDFEYVGTPSALIRQNFTAFCRELNRQAKAINPNFSITVDVYADSAVNERLWDLTELGQSVDQIIIMAYDFHRPSSTQAGPVAPLYGGDQNWEHDITSLIAAHLERNPPNKLLLGIPFYGYQWTTSSADYLAATYKRTGGIATLRTVSELLNDQEKEITVNWDSVALTPWLSYPLTKTTFKQVHYENAQSIGYKLDLVNDTEMAGIAIWALGYEGNNPWVWQTIESKLN